MMKHQGSTLFELLITLCITALLLGLALPQFSQQIQKSRTQAAAQMLLQTIETARTIAVMQNKRTLLIPNEKWHQGWKLFIDLNDNGVMDPDEPIINETAELKGVRITGNSSVNNYVSFISTGEGRKAGKANAGAFISGTFKICPETPGNGYKLVLSRGGRLRSQSIEADDCANQT